MNTPYTVVVILEVAAEAPQEAALMVEEMFDDAQLHDFGIKISELRAAEEDSQFSFDPESES